MNIPFIYDYLKESQYWADNNNCNLNITDKFIDRRFTCKKTTKNINQSPSNNMMYTIILGKCDKYKNTFDDCNITVFVENINKTYCMPNCLMHNNDNNLKLKKHDIENIIISTTNEQELYNIFNSFVISKDYCHIVFNNKQILNKMEPLFVKYAPLYKYLLGYAWLCFITEETLVNINTKKEYRYVYDIHTANKLPVFPFIFSDISQNPYLPIAIDKNTIDISHNAMGLYCIDNLDGYGVCTFDEFQLRMNIFVTGNSKINIFNGIDWNFFAIIGSVMTACLQKKPLLLNNSNWHQYFDKYYINSDIDMMCNDSSIYGYCEKVDNVVKILKENIINNNNNNECDIEPIKNISIIVTKHFFIENVAEFNKIYNTKYTVNELIDRLEIPELKEYIYMAYINIKSKHNAKIAKSIKEQNYYLRKFMDIANISDMTIYFSMEEIIEKNIKITDNEIYLYVNDVKENKTLEDTNYLLMKISENIRFKIKIKNIRIIEIFRSPYDEFFTTVSRFHLPCVRAYYQGDNVYMLPSCISAMMTGLNIDYKYFSNVRDPIEIINKYRMRGFGILLNKTELEHMSSYNSQLPTCCELFNIMDNSPKEIEKIFGPKELTDNIYKNSNVITNVNYIKTLDDLKKYYLTISHYDSNKFDVDMFDFKIIANNGNVEPYLYWISKIYYDMIYKHSNLPLAVSTQGT